MTRHDKILRSKLGLLKLVEELGNVSRACELMGYSRDSYYRLKELYDKGGTLALQEKSRKKPNLKNRVDEDVERSITELAFSQPFYGQSKVSEELKKQGILVSPAGVRSVLQRYDLENFKKRLKGLGTKILQEGYRPSEWQIKALQQAKRQYGAISPMDTYFPGHLVIQSVEPVASHKTLGDLYQYVLVDVYTRLAFVYICDDLSTTCAIKSLEFKMLPFFKKKKVEVQRLATTKETCFYGKNLKHKFLKFAKDNEIELSHLAKKSLFLKPLRDFLKLINNDFYSDAFRTKRYTSTAAIQADLDKWIAAYNKEQPIYERYNYGKTPMATYEAILPFTNYLKHGPSKKIPNGLHDLIDVLTPLVIPESFKG